MKSLEIKSVLETYYNRQVSTIEIWAYVYRVKIEGIGYRFISKETVRRLAKLYPMIKTVKFIIDSLMAYGRKLLNQHLKYIVLLETGNAIHTDELEPAKFYLEINRCDSVVNVIREIRRSFSSQLKQST